STGPLPLEAPTGAMTEPSTVQLKVAWPKAASSSAVERRHGPLILWNHRWEHDKQPEVFFEALASLDRKNKPYRLAIAGLRFERWPACFDEARERLGDRIEQFGPLAQREDYVRLLQRADIAVSTAAHEFLGISMIEAAHFGAFVLVPNRLAYPDVFPPAFRYETDEELVERLAASIDAFVAGHSLRIDGRDLSRPFLRPALHGFAELFGRMTERVVTLKNMVSEQRL
ncbi:MAG: glycosyltransferase, partial [Myxococcota bacterium]